MENKVFNVAISAMSKKDNGQFKSNRLSAFLVPVDDEQEKKMIDFGMNKYTSKNGESFFVVKTSEKIAYYTDTSNNYFPLGGTKEDKLFKTKDGQSVLVNIITSESKGNKFYRLQAIKDTNDALEDIESQNPFDNKNK